MICDTVPRVKQEIYVYILFCLSQLFNHIFHSPPLRRQGSQLTTLDLASKYICDEGDGENFCPTQNVSISRRRRDTTLPRRGSRQDVVSLTMPLVKPPRDLKTIRCVRKYKDKNGDTRYNLRVLFNYVLHGQGPSHLYSQFSQGGSRMEFDPRGRFEHERTFPNLRHRPNRSYHLSSGQECHESFRTSIPR